MPARQVRLALAGLRLSELLPPVAIHQRGWRVAPVEWVRREVAPWRKERQVRPEPGLAGLRLASLVRSPWREVPVAARTAGRALQSRIPWARKSGKGIRQACGDPEDGRSLNPRLHSRWRMGKLSSEHQGRRQTGLGKMAEWRAPRSGPLIPVRSRKEMVGVCRPGNPGQEMFRRCLVEYS